jgi:hypothetical protein
MGKPQSTETPYNAGDEGQVAERQAKAKNKADERAEGLRYIMATRQGRCWMRHLLGEKLFTRVGTARPAGIFTGNSTTFYNTALRETGDIIHAEIATLCKRECRLMEDEGEING